MVGSSHHTQPGKVLILLLSLPILVSQLLHRYDINVDSAPYPVRKNVLNQIQQTKFVDVNQEDKIAQYTINHFSFYKLTDTISIPESGSQRTRGILCKDIINKPGKTATGKMQLKSDGKYVCYMSLY